MTELQAIARYTMTAGREEELLALLTEFAKLVRQEPGNLSFDVYRHLDDPRKVVLLERYQSREAFAQHLAAEYFRAYVLAEFIPRLDERTVELLDVEAADQQ